MHLGSGQVSLAHLNICIMMKMQSHNYECVYLGGGFSRTRHRVKWIYHPLYEAERNIVKLLERNQLRGKGNEEA